MALETTSSSMVNRMIRAARIEVPLYEEVEADLSATNQALLVVVLVAVASGIGEPKKPGPMVQLSPSIHIATDLDQWCVHCLHLPAVQQASCEPVVNRPTRELGQVIVIRQIEDMGPVIAQNSVAIMPVKRVYPLVAVAFVYRRRTQHLREGIGQEVLKTPAKLPVQCDLH